MLIVGSLLMILMGLTLIAVMIYTTAPLNKWATVIRSETMKIVVEGETFFRLILNSADRHYDARERKIKPGKNFLQTPLHFFGRFWVSGLYPARKVYTFPVGKNRLRPERDEKGNYVPIDQRIQYIKSEIVDFLPTRLIIALYIEDVDFRDGTRVNFLLLTTFDVVNPYQLLFKVGGDKYLIPLTAAVRARVLDYCKNKSYTEDYLSKEDSKFLEFLQVINPHTTGIEETIGVTLVDNETEDFSLSPKSQAIQNALERETIAIQEAAAIEAEAKGKKAAAILEAEGKKQSAILVAEGQAKARELQAAAEGKWLETRVKAFTDAGASANVAARTIEGIDRAESIGKGGNVTSYVEGGGAAIPTFPLNSPAPEKNPKPNKGAAA